MRTLNVEEISKNIKEMCIEANHFLSKDMDIAMKNAVSTEKSPLGKKILSQLQDNLKIAGKDMIPICQDTGMAVVFLEIGQDVHFEGGNLEDAVNEGIRRGYVDGYLRKSVVKDPILRENTKDNTPGIIHYNICVGMPSPWGRCPWPRPRTDEGKPSGNFPQMGFDRKVCPHQPPAGGSFSRGRSLGRILLCVTAL